MRENRQCLSGEKKGTCLFSDWLGSPNVMISTSFIFLQMA